MEHMLDVFGARMVFLLSLALLICAIGGTLLSIVHLVIIGIIICSLLIILAVVGMRKTYKKAFRSMI